MQRYFSKEKIDNIFVLTDSDYHHIKTVMRMKENDNVEVVYNEKVYLSSIHFVNKDVNVVCEKELECLNPLEKNICLIMPFLHEQKMDYIFQKATELGISEFILTEYTRSVVKVDNKKIETKMARWKKIVKEAAEQSMRLSIPTISIKSKKEIYTESGLKIICSTKETKNNLKNTLKNNASYDRILIVVGPEGGITDQEENEFEKNGFIKTTLGRQIMRVETVPLFVLSCIRYENME